MDKNLIATQLEEIQSMLASLLNETEGTEIFEHIEKATAALGEAISSLEN